MMQGKMRIEYVERIRLNDTITADAPTTSSLDNRALPVYRILYPIVKNAQTAMINAEDVG